MSYPPQQPQGQPQQPPWPGQGYPQQPQQQWGPPLQYGGQQPPPPPGYYQQPPMPPGRPPRRKSHRGLKITLGVVGGFFAISIIASLANGNGSGAGATAAGTTPAAAPASPAAAQQAPAPPARQTVTYEVTGSSADVTYGPAGTNLTGTVPMSRTAPLRTPAYYAISAQLQGGGTVACKILVNGAVISQASAQGSYNIASCQIDQNPISGQWEDTNASG